MDTSEEVLLQAVLLPEAAAVSAAAAISEAELARDPPREQL
jgi:hypothetical protein